ncbi:DUF421 domain-containing protein [Oceanicola sp. D3]|uniref:DUF421 domain-containing protein n=1 Tax=Oceanicola sp. D3 TaxID=2587163 RepID=UPI001120B922|nr:YetF domain-containing protein [Oceanicola sp. D3]QDC08416.1 DUF421 domain-containing protein [Oceanicola sp. D3]
MDWSEMLFQGWSGILRTVIVGALGYLFLVVALRISGKRTLAKLNAFDLVVTVAFGSTLAAILLNEDIALAEGATALTLLIALQYAVTSLSVRSSTFARAVRSEPSLLLRDGAPLERAMRAARVTREELETVARREGHRDLSEVAAVILESDGSFSVMGSARQDGDRAREGRAKDGLTA